MADGWRKGLSFAERLAAISKITSAYEDAHAAFQAAEASKHAKASERTAREDASSLAHYHEMCAQAVDALIKSSHSAVSERHEIEQADEAGLESSTPGIQIGAYVNAQHYKNGLFSEIFRATGPARDRTDDQGAVVALKVTTPSVMSPPHDSVREARILERAKSEQIIPLLDQFHLAGGRFIMALPFLPYDLDTLLHRGRLTAPAARSFLKDLFAGLAHIHSLGIIHRDIKPSNILLSSPSGPAYISDFGIAWSPLDPSSEKADEKILDVGTTCYRPPELLFGHQSYGTTLDMWAAGCVAAQAVCLNGRTLFDAGDLGSELALIKSIFETLGTPGLGTWPEASTFPDWGKMNFKQYPSKPWHEILPAAGAHGLELVSKLVLYESANRLTATQALQHQYLTEVGNP